MIALFRIDYRLLHFQTASVWPNKIGADTIVIANDAIVKDQMQIGLIKMIAPKGIKLRLCSIAKAAAYLNSPDSQSRRIEVLVESPSDCVKIAEEVSGIHSVCAGLMKSGEGKRIVSKTLANQTEPTLFIIKTITTNLSYSGTQSIQMITYYPLYPDI